jgi:hypothetical protein
MFILAADVRQRAKDAILLFLERYHFKADVPRRQFTKRSGSFDPSFS